MNERANLVLVPVLVLALVPACSGGSSVGSSGSGTAGSDTLDLYDASRDRPLKVDIWYPAISTTAAVTRTCRPRRRRSSSTGSPRPSSTSTCAATPRVRSG